MKNSRLTVQIRAIPILGKQANKHKRKNLKGCDDDYFVHHAHAQLARLYYDGGVE